MPDKPPSTPVQTPLESAKAKMASLSGEKRWAISCYIPIINVITCVLTSVRMVGSQFCMFHARQGLALFGLWFLTILIALVSPTLSLMLWGVVLLLHITGVVIVIQNKQTQIPILGQLAMKIPEKHIFTVLTGKTPEAKVGADVPTAGATPPAGQTQAQPEGQTGDQPAANPPSAGEAQPAPPTQDSEEKTNQ